MSFIFLNQYNEYKKSRNINNAYSNFMSRIVDEEITPILNKYFPGLSVSWNINLNINALVITLPFGTDTNNNFIEDLEEKLGVNYWGVDKGPTGLNNPYIELLFRLAPNSMLEDDDCRKYEYNIEKDNAYVKLVW